MLKEAIDFVLQQGRSQIEPKPFDLPGDPAHVRYVRDKDGAIVRMDCEPGVRGLVLERIEDLLSLAVAHFDPEVADKKRMAVFYNTSRIDLVFDTSNGREHAVVHLPWTAEYRFFLARAKEPAISVQELRAALRFVLSETFRDDKLVEQVSKIDFSTFDRATMNLDRGKESLGAAIQRETSAPVGLPGERQTFNVRMFAVFDMTFRAPITCTIDPDLQGRRWQLIPNEASLIDFVEQQLTQLRQTLVTGLKDTKVPIYQGNFNQDQPDREVVDEE